MSLTSKQKLGTVGVVGTAVATGFVYRQRHKIRCLWRGWHDPQRQPMGGFKCRDCETVAVTFEELSNPRLKKGAL